MDSSKIPSGTVTLACVEAELTRNVAKLTKMDPFVKFRCHENTFITPVCSNGGKHPKWSKFFEVRVRKRFEHSFEFDVTDQR